MTDFWVATGRLCLDKNVRQVAQGYVKKTAWHSPPLMSMLRGLRHYLVITQKLRLSRWELLELNRVLYVLDKHNFFDRLAEKWGDVGGPPPGDPEWREPLAVVGLACVDTAFREQVHGWAKDPAVSLADQLRGHPLAFEISTTKDPGGAKLEALLAKSSVADLLEGIDHEGWLVPVKLGSGVGTCAPGFTVTDDYIHFQSNAVNYWVLRIVRLIQGVFKGQSVLTTVALFGKELLDLLRLLEDASVPDELGSEPPQA